MDSQTKRDYKRKLKLFLRLAYTSLAVFVIEVIIAFFTVPLLPGWARAIYFAIVILTPIGGLILTTYGYMYENKLRLYKRRIREYRTRVLFQKCMQLVSVDNLVGAIDYYTLMPYGDQKDFVYSYIIAKCHYSLDESLKNKGAEKLAHVLNTYDPDSLVMQF